MRKVKRGFSSPSKLVGKVFKRHSSNAESSMTDTSSTLSKQIEMLKQQIDSLKLDTESKEVKVAKLAREKEKLNLSLAKIRRSNDTLTRQLEDERNFYYKEKESYCHEMNEYKKLRKVLSNSTIASQIENKDDVEKLKKNLEQTLQTNYNLSVKFLRLRDAKHHLNGALKKTEDEHRRIVGDLRVKIDNLTAELKDILNQKFDAPLSPSNKKYLQLLNQNSSLVYENLYLQTQLDQLKSKLKRTKIRNPKSENSVRLHQQKRKTKSDDRVVKIFERERRSGLPTLTILNDHDVKFSTSERKLQLPTVNESKLEVFQVSGVESRNSGVSVRRRSLSAPRILQAASFVKS